ncbi:hypothetical protein M407DRAFT_187593 [Tulasnella calospora MUT 4182]|uniref:Uncharacterized protein n=1 Tax=Tulasnella calospora MUT 4182 TaxID=1051891 RepID=A0A0C3QMB2_9AGAM|nr:hypothetical protein M407DRAFT_187593 [Tulasnella calospora MUT 4182]
MSRLNARGQVGGGGSEDEGHLRPMCCSVHRSLLKRRNFVQRIRPVRFQPRIIQALTLAYFPVTLWRSQVCCGCGCGPGRELRGKMGEECLGR